MIPAQVAWALALFKVSILKQQKWRILQLLTGPTRELACLDLGSDNGVISYLFRQQGGRWDSADLDPGAVASTRELVASNVHLIDGRTLPFGDAAFDRVVIVDLLEHVEDDRALLDELARVLKPGGILVVNVPHIKRSLLRRVRLWLGQTDARHGHVRPGYTAEGVRAALGEAFTVTESLTYSKFFTEAVDTAVRWAVDVMKRDAAAGRKGAMVTGADLHRHRRLFRLYQGLYPVMWLASRLDALLAWRSGYMLAVKAVRTAEPAAATQPALAAGAVA